MKLHTAALSLVLLAACTNPPPAGGDELLLPDAGAAATGPAPIVLGTVLDANTGKPVAGATVKAPGGLQAKSDEHGRFVLKGLALGTAGELVGTTQGGLSGKNRLRPLAGGPLEVVLYVR